jgi:hypothetical protein
MLQIGRWRHLSMFLKNWHAEIHMIHMPKRTRIQNLAKNLQERRQDQPTFAPTAPSSAAGDASEIRS